MNERIRSLAEQSGLLKILAEHAGEFGNGLLEDTLYPECQRFAELIVKDYEENGPGKVAGAMKTGTS